MVKESLIVSDATTTFSLRDSKEDEVGSEAVAIGVVEQHHPQNLIAVYA